MSSLSVEATSKSNITVRNTDTSIGLVDGAEALVDHVSVLSRAIRVHAESTLTSRLILSSSS